MTILPHERLLAVCSRIDPEPPALARAIDEVDWRRFVALSVRHGIAPLAAKHLVGLEDSRIPPEVLSILGRIRAGNRLRNDVYYRETARLVNALDEDHIPCRVLKGVGLSLSVYSDCTLRNFSDLDILVEESDYDRAALVAEERGFAEESCDYASRALERMFIGRCSEDILTETVALRWDPVLTHKMVERHRHRVSVEVHRGLFRDGFGFRRQVDLKAAWERPIRTQLPDGTPIDLLSAEATLVHLAGHAAEHAFGRLIHFTDITALIARFGKTLDWSEAVRVAYAWKCDRALVMTLDLCRREFGAEVPELEGFRAGSNALRIEDVARTPEMGGDELALRRWIHAGRPIRKMWRAIVPSKATMEKLHSTRSGLKLSAHYIARPVSLAVRAMRAGHIRRRAA